MTPKVSTQDVTERLVSELVSQVDPSEILSKDGLFAKLKKQIVERVLQAEMDHKLGYSKHSKTSKATDNRRNGSYSKNIIDNEGNTMSISVPRETLLHE